MYYHELSIFNSITSIFYILTAQFINLFCNIDLNLNIYRLGLFVTRFFSFWIMHFVMYMDSLGQEYRFKTELS